MSEGPDERLNEPGGLSQSRADFAASFERRLQGLRAALDDLELEPDSAARRDMLLRRIHALGAAAKVLGFAAAAEQLSELEDTVQDLGFDDVRAQRLEHTRVALDLLPGLIARARRDGGAPARSRARAAEAMAPSVHDSDALGPIAVLLYGPVTLEAMLTAAAADAELEVDLCADPAGAVDRIMAFGPDVVIIADDHPGAPELLQRLRPGEDEVSVPIVLVRSGNVEISPPVGRSPVNIVDAPVRGHELWIAVQHSMGPPVAADSAHELGSEPTVGELAEHLALEVRRALVSSARALEKGARLRVDNPSELVAPLWSALATIRETIVANSNGAVDFEPLGPHGGVALAPRMEDRRKGSPRRTDEGVDLKGRRVLVVDDDASVVDAIAGLVTDAGARALVARHGRDGLRIAQQQWPDLIISDIYMPEMDGLSLCREIKRDVAVGDTPVILLSWKEDLLLRLRELGADADGYLRKEASTASILRTVRELLAPRARVESRLGGAGEVRGRLDGLTPRLILQLVCKNRSDACVAFRDPAFLYEAQIRGSRLVCATRTATDGSFERGRSVLAALVGATAGRFAVSEDSSRCREDFSGTIAEVLAEPIRRARAAQRATLAGMLGTLKRVAIDPAVMAPYLRVMPPQGADLLEQLMDGASPRALLLSGSVAPNVLERVLSDAARRGAIIAAEGRGGVDLLEAALRELESPAEMAEAVVSEDAASEGEETPKQVAPGGKAPSHPPRFAFLLSPPPGPVIEAQDTADPALSESPGGPRGGSTSAAETSLRPLYSLEPPETVEIDEAWGSEPPGAIKPSEASLQERQRAGAPAVPNEPATKRGVGSAEPSPAPTATDGAGGPKRTPPEADASLERSGEAAVGIDLADAVMLAMVESGTAGPPPVRPKEPRLPPSESKGSHEPPTEEAKISASSGQPASPAGPPRRPVAPSLETTRGPAVTARLSSPGAGEAEGAEASPDASSGARIAGSTAADDDDLGTFELRPFSRDAAVSPPKQAEASGTDPAKVGLPPPIAGGSSVSDEDEPESSIPEDDASGADPHEEVTVPLVRGVEDNRRSVSRAATATGPEGSDSQASPETPRRLDSKGAEATDDAPASHKEPRTVAEGGAADSASEGPLRASGAAPSSSRMGSSERDATSPGSASDRKSLARRQELIGWLRVAAMAILAGVVAFFAMRRVIQAMGWDGADATRQTRNAPGVAGPSAPTSRPTNAAAPAPHRQKAMPQVERLPLPPGVNVAAGQGLLEVDTGGNHVIYVDGVFVGRGPLRRVTLPSGRHEVRVSLGSQKHEQSLEVPKGARVRLPLEEVWK